MSYPYIERNYILYDVAIYEDLLDLRHQRRFWNPNAFMIIIWLNVYWN